MHLTMWQIIRGQINELQKQLLTSPDTTSIEQEIARHQT